MQLVINNQVIFKQLNQLAQTNLLNSHHKYNHLFFKGTFYRYGLIKNKNNYQPAICFRNVKLSPSNHSVYSINLKTFWIFLYSGLAQLGRLQNRLQVQFNLTIQTNFTKQHRPFYLIKYVSQVQLARKHKLPILPIKSSALCGIIILNNPKLLQYDFQIFKCLTDFSKWLCNYVEKFSHTSYLKYVAKQAKIYTPYSAIFTRLANAQTDLKLLAKTKYVNNLMTKRLVIMLRINVYEYLASSASFIKDKTKNNGFYFHKAVTNLKAHQYSDANHNVNQAVKELKAQNFSSVSVKKQLKHELHQLAQELTKYIKDSDKDTKVFDFKVGKATLVQNLIKHPDLINELNIKLSNQVYKKKLLNNTEELKSLSHYSNHFNNDTSALKNVIKDLKQALLLKPNQIYYHHHTISAKFLLKLIKKHL